MRSRRATLRTPSFDYVLYIRKALRSGPGLLFLPRTRLNTPETGVDTIGHIDKFIVFAVFFELTVFEDENAVGVADGAEAVGDDDGGAPDDDLFERALNEGFGLVVDGGGGFVED